MISKEDRKQIEAFVNSDAMYEAVRRVLLSGIIGEDFASKNWVFKLDASQSDSAFGKEVKIAMKALQWIETGFNELKKLASSNPQATPKNEAR